MPGAIAAETRSVNPFVIAVDNQEPVWDSWEPHLSTPTVRRSLQIGQYSIVGMEKRVVIERKNVDTLVRSLSYDRAYFEQLLDRAQAIPSFWVFIESTHREILSGNYQRRKDPQAIWNSITVLMARYNVPIIMVGDVKTGASLAETFLSNWWWEQVRSIESAQRAAANLGGRV